MLGFDYHDSAQAQKFWDRKPVEIESCPQGFPLSPAIKNLEDLALARQVAHGGDDLLGYAVGCAELDVSVKEKFAIRKPNRKVMAARVDPLTAVLTALHTRIRNQDNHASVFGGPRFSSSSARARRAARGAG